MAFSNMPVPYPGAAAAGDATAKAGTIFPSAARAATTYTSNEIYNGIFPGVRLFIDITNANGGTVTAKIQNLDPVSGNWVDLGGGVSAALGTNGTSTLTVYPGVSESANVDIADPLGQRWRVSVTVATATVTFSIGAEYLK